MLFTHINKSNKCIMSLKHQSCLFKVDQVGFSSQKFFARKTKYYITYAAKTNAADQSARMCSLNRIFVVRKSL